MRANVAGMGTRKKRRLTETESAVLDLARAGRLGVEHSLVYRKEISTLAKEGLISRDDGHYTSTTPPPAPRDIRLMLTITPETASLLDATAALRGVTRAEAAEEILASARLGGARRSDPPSASGTRPATRK